MNGDNTYKKYEPIKIPNRKLVLDDETGKSLPQTGKDAPASGLVVDSTLLFNRVADSYQLSTPTSDSALDSALTPTSDSTLLSDSNGLFYEIDYDSCPIKGAGKFVLKSQKIEPQEKDAIRDRFYQMRDVARQYRTPFTDYMRFFDRRALQETAVIFYKQAVFMKDFEDDYTKQIPFSSYYPNYQMLGYEQLRTYFTWRTRVRKGMVNPTSLSYAFLYIYELLNNIGADTPQDGLEKLLAFWTSFRKLDSSLDKYVVRWLKDYYIYYGLPQTFQEFVEECHLTVYYPDIADAGDSFDLFREISKYDIMESAFYTEERSKLIKDCFSFVMEKIRKAFETAGIPFDNAFFHPTKKVVMWKPFKDAVFYQSQKNQQDRRIVFSANEIYIRRKNQWTFSTTLTTEKGRQFMGYVMKEMESVLRRLTKYKYKITANLTMVNKETLQKLNKSGIHIENIVPDAVLEFYREATKTVVTVDLASLARIRKEALATQESLIVEETMEATESTKSTDLGHSCSHVHTPASPLSQDLNIFGDTEPMETKPTDTERAETESAETEPADTESTDFKSYDMESTETESSNISSYHSVMDSVSGVWKNLQDSLNEKEKQALVLILQGENIKEFADSNNMMLEVLVDGINEKAMDLIGDNILDEEQTVYEDYKEQVKGMVEGR